VRYGGLLFLCSRFDCHDRAGLFRAHRNPIGNAVSLSFTIARAHAHSCAYAHPNSCAYAHAYAHARSMGGVFQR
jgi:hypothetical protein